MFVLPKYQSQGVGRVLLNHTINEAKRLGYKGIIIFGHPEYYRYRGFVPAKKYNITTSWGANFDAFMAMPLFEGAFHGISGRFYEDPAFHMENSELEEFDKTFPFKEKLPIISIDVLLNKLAAPAKRAIIEHEVKELAALIRFSREEISSWHGIGKNALKVINEVFKEYGYPIIKGVE